MSKKFSLDSSDKIKQIDSLGKFVNNLNNFPRKAWLLLSDARQCFGRFHSSGHTPPGPL